MHDPLAYAAFCRAENAISMVRESLGRDRTAGKKAFVEIARTIAKAQSPENAMSFLQHSRNELVQKATAHALLDDVWHGTEAQSLAANFIASVAEPDVLTAIAKFGKVLPKLAGRVLIASGATGNTLSEGFPKVVRKLDLNVGADIDFMKSTAAVVVSQELLNATGTEGTALFEAELAKAVVRACNVAVINSLIDSSTTTVSAGTDPLASLRAGLAAAGQSTGYVVAMPAGDVAWLATTTENKGGMCVRGGTFVTGVEIIALDDATNTTVIPASRFAFLDGGIELRPAGHASVSMADSPTSPSQQVSLWQTNSVGLLVERYWALSGETSGVVAVGGA